MGRIPDISRVDRRSYTGLGSSRTRLQFTEIQVLRLTIPRSAQLQQMTDFYATHVGTFGVPWHGSYRDSRSGSAGSNIGPRRRRAAGPGLRLRCDSAARVV